MSDARMAEQLWVKAHELVKAGQLAQAVRDLAKCYELLKAAGDPRLPQVHRRWIEVYKLYQERQKHAQAAQQAAPQATSAARPAAKNAPATQAAPAHSAPAASGPPSGGQALHAAPSAQPAAAFQSAPSARPEAEPSAQGLRNLGEEAETAANQGNLPKAIALYEQILRLFPQNELAKERLAELRAAHAKAEAMRTARASEDAAARGLASAEPKRGPLRVKEKVAFLEGLLRQVEERRRAG